MGQLLLKTMRYLRSCLAIRESQGKGGGGITLEQVTLNPTLCYWNSVEMQIFRGNMLSYQIYHKRSHSVPEQLKRRGYRK